MCIEAIKEEPWQLEHIPDHLKTQKICNKAVWEDPSSLHYVPDWFVTQQQVRIWNDDDNHCDNDRFIKWYKDYQKSKTQKAKIEEELMPVPWHPSRWWDWCVPR